MNNCELCQYVGLRVETPGEYEIRSKIAAMKQRFEELPSNIEFETKLAKIKIANFNKYGKPLEL